MTLRSFCVALALAAGQTAALRPGGFRLSGLEQEYPGEAEMIYAASNNSTIKAYNLSVPIDHFHNESKYEPHSDGFFNLRYWLDTKYYKKGGPIIILHSGEFNSEGRLPFLEHGIVPILAKATGGVGIVLEHRYYGTSWPTKNATTESYRFLTTDQALADTAYFSNHIKIPGLEQYNLTAPATPHILYGGSYAGGFVAIARKVYPNVFWGAISSSGVTAAIDYFWQYFEATRHFAPGDCSPTIQKLTAIIDTKLLSASPKSQDNVKSWFGLQDLKNDEFASILSQQPSLQETSWDPAEDSTNFGSFCAVISSDAFLFKSTEHLLPPVSEAVEAAGYGDDSRRLTVRMLNFIGYVRDNVKQYKKGPCKGKKNLRECMSARFQKGKTEITADSWQRSWLYQTCTEWGYFQSGHATPQDRLPMVSRALTAEYSSYTCKSFFNITTRPNVDIINKHGGFNFSFPRVAIIDGRQDPWRSAGAHAIGLPNRESTPSEPFELIDWGVHHWDENGLSPDSHKEKGLPPKQIVDIQRKEVDIVKTWLKEFKHRDHDGGVAEL